MGAGCVTDVDICVWDGCRALLSFEDPTIGVGSCGGNAGRSGIDTTGGNNIGGSEANSDAPRGTGCATRGTGDSGGLSTSGYRS